MEKRVGNAKLNQDLTLRMPLLHYNFHLGNGRQEL